MAKLYPLYVAYTFGKDMIQSRNTNLAPIPAIDLSNGSGTYLNLCISEKSYIIIDEAHFLTMEDAKRVARPCFDDIVIAGCDLDFRGIPFESINYLCSCDHPNRRIVTHTAACGICGDEAIFTQRVSNGGVAITDGELYIMDGDVGYSPRCSACFVRP
jgi:thymidine kinase